MPITISFDLPGSGPHDIGRIQSMFERFGWERAGDSVYRYPRSDDTEPEDWLNRVIPALMLFRTFVVTTGRSLSSFTVSANSSTAYNRASKLGTAPTNDLELFRPSNQKFGAKNLWAWLESMEWPYPRDDRNG